MNAKFHWVLPPVHEGAVSAINTASGAEEPWMTIARSAEALGMTSLILPFEVGAFDPIFLACAIGLATQKLQCVVTYQPGLMQPTSFIQQVNTLSSAIAGRLAIQLEVGTLPSQQQIPSTTSQRLRPLQRADEFLQVCRAFWQQQGDVSFQGDYYRLEGGRINAEFIAGDRPGPDLYLSGTSPQIGTLARQHDACWMVDIDQYSFSMGASKLKSPQCLQLGILCRPTRQEALAVAQALRQKHPNEPEPMSSSHIHNTPLQRLTGGEELCTYIHHDLLTKEIKVPSSTLVGSSADITAALGTLQSWGVDQFAFYSPFPLEDMTCFGREVLPILSQQNWQESKRMPPESVVPSATRL